ncbi:MAG: helix-turn-helix transcriptional regulator [Candidatus Gastranaerophilales bacterium]
MQNTKQNIGRRLSELRKKAGLKQADLAELIGVEPQYVSKIECGYCYPSFELLDKIASKMGLETYKLLQVSHIKSCEELKQEINEKINHFEISQLQLIHRIINQI